MRRATSTAKLQARRLARRAPETQAILALLDGADGRTRAVGGIVRDTLLERPRETADIDFATELLPDEVMLPRRARPGSRSIRPASSTAR